MKNNKAIFFLLAIFLLFIFYSCDLPPVSIEDRLEAFQDDLNKNAVDRANTNFQDHFHSDMSQYAAMAGGAAHTYFDAGQFPISSQDFDIIPVGSATDIGGNIMRQNADIIRDGAADYDFSNTFFNMKQEDGEDWYIIRFEAGGAVILQ